jgi:ferredoxin
MVEIELDGKKVEVLEGSMVMHAAEKAGTYIPHFCYHKKLSIAANCRMCLVDVEKGPKPMPACATPVTQGMIVRTKSDKAIKAQQSVMEFLLINHPLDCPICDQGGECQLQDLAVGYGSSSRATKKKSAWCSTRTWAADFHGGNEPLHPLHPLRALRPGSGRRHGTGHDSPRRALRDHHRGGRYGGLRAVGQHDRHLPGGRADQQAFPLQRPYLGTVAPQVGGPHDPPVPT